MNKLVLALGFVTMQFLGFSQNGLEKIIVEKYYIANAADTSGSPGKLPIGSVTYRVYVDLLPGYRFQALYGNSDHPLKFNTSTAFFNNEDRGQTTANAIASAQLKNNTVALDSWFSVGASATGQFGVLKSEDDGKANLLTLSSILNNTAAAIGIGLKTQDGNMAVTGKQPEAVTFVGFDPSNGVFDATSLQGNSFLTKDGAISALSGATGPTSENRVLIGQFTTDGVFTFELNIQIGTPTPGVSEKYVASNPINGEKTIPSLILTSNNPPVVEITSPANNAKLKTGIATTITAGATDTDGTVKNVEFYIDNVSLGIDSIAPYSITYTPTDGAHKITAVATDNKSAQTTSSTVNILASNNIPPVITISVPKIAHLGKVSLEATATDADGTIKMVSFYVDSVFVGKDSIAPYNFDWNSVLGKHTVYATAIDDKGEKVSSTKEMIEVVTNIAPEVVIITPTNNENNIISGSEIVILASASDADGTIKKVEFFVDGKSIGIDSLTPYSANYKVGSTGKHFITAVATDNQQTVTSSTTINIEVKDNQTPIVNITNYFQTIYKSDVVKITANATDIDGTITEVEFFIDSLSIGIDQTAPYTKEWIAISGVHHVKAVAKDNNGAKTNSSIKTIDVRNFTAGIEELNNTTFNIYPNPATNQVSFTLNQPIETGSTKYQLTDNIGKIVLENIIPSIQTTEKQTIDLEHLEKGVYHLQLIVNGNSTSQKLIIE